MAVRLATLALVACVALATGCSDDAPSERAATPPSTVADNDADFFLTVSNQSFEHPSVVVDVTIDNRRVVSERFDVDGQHTFAEFALAVGPGDHTLRAASRDGTAIGEIFTIPDGAIRYGTLFYWEGDDGRPYFDLQFFDQPPAFG